jgi:ferredoxin
MDTGATAGDPPGKPGHFSITVDGATDAFDCGVDTPVLIAMERSGRKAIAVGCRGGGCGTCRVRVRAGSYRTGRMSRAHVTVEEERQGYALACKLFPLEDLLLTPARRMVGQAPQMQED